MFTIWLAHVTFCTAYMVVNSRKRELDQSIEEAAMELDATPVKVFFIITLPMLVSSNVRMGVNPEINALATLILAVVDVIGLIAWWLMSRKDKQHQRDRQPAARG